MRKSSLRREQILTGASLSRRIKPSAAALAVAACFTTSVALANPTNPTVVHGTATFQQAGNILNITNSANAIINWGSFSISVGELTRFIQPSALSAVLNRVTGQDPSAILGALQSNGRVFLINPNGIVFGAGAQIDVAGLVASTLNLSNEDFLNNRMRFTDGIGAGSVVNQGQITGGSVYLVGNAVTNNGLITSPNGEVVLAAGNSVELVNPGTPNLRVEINAPDNEARNLGTISAEAGRIGIYAGLIKQSGTISADSAVAEGGRILLKSTQKTTLDAGSVTSARGTNGGEIIVLSDMQSGTTVVAGTLDVSVSPLNSSGNGGFVETSAGNVQIANSAALKLSGAGAGKAGTWLIDPYDFVIASSGGNITAATLASALSVGNVVISTFAYGEETYYGGPPSLPNGDIFVNQAVGWDSEYSLTLTAYRNVEVNQPITNAGIGAIRLYAGWDESSPPSSPTLVLNGGDINVNANITSLGGIFLEAGKDVNVTNASIISGGSDAGNAIVSIDAHGGNVTVNNSILRARGGNSNLLGSQADIFVYANSGTATFENGSLLEAIGGNSTDAYGGGPSYINVFANATNYSGSQVVATGGSGESGGSSYIQSISNGHQQITSSIFTATGGASTNPLDGGSAEIYIEGAEGAPSLTMTGSQMRAISGNNGGGGSGEVYIYVNGNVTINNSVLEGRGNYSGIYIDTFYGSVDTTESTLIASGPNGYIEIDAYYGDVTLGALSSSQYVSVFSANGAIVDGNAGLNISAPSAYLQGSQGVGTIANPIETQVDFLDVYVYGSSGEIGIFGDEIGISSGEIGIFSGEIGIINSGNLQLGSFYNTYGNVAIGATGNLTVDGGEGSAGGSLMLGANGNLNIFRPIDSSGSMTLQTGGELTIGGPSSGSFVEVYSGDTLTMVAGTNLNVLPSSYGSSSSVRAEGIATVITGGNVLVDQSTIYGSPDVFMQVGGLININGTDVYRGRIEAESANTINVNFTSSTGGFSVNGVAGLVFDPVTQTGFWVDGGPASLGNGLNVIYTGTPPVSTLTIPTENLIVAMGESSKPPDPEKDKDVFDDVEEKKKKDAPVCR